MRFRRYAPLLLLLGFTSIRAQILHPATWSQRSSTTSAKAGDVLEVIFTATIDKNWYLYSSEFPCEDGPIKTTVEFEKSDGFEVVEGMVAVGDIAKHDPIFECDVRIFKDKAEFRQKVRVLKGPLTIRGAVDYQVCSDIDGKCIPFNEDFELAVIAVRGGGTSVKTGPEVKPDTAMPEVDPIPVLPPDQPVQGPVLDSELVNASPAQGSVWTFFFLAFLAGLAALLTPCVFPMIPMTVSYFTGHGTKAQAIIYGISIIGVYTVIGALVAPLMGPETANHLSTEWLPNIIFFLVFVVFGLSFLGWFDIVLPSRLVNKVDRQADKGGLGGVFFMAFTLVLVSFSCTGPIVGSILVSSAGGQFLKPIIGMFGFALAFALPFTLFALFPRWLSNLPKSGGWLNSVKVVLGFIELALAFKFLSIADQAFHWGILDRDINIAIWIVLGIFMGVYLLGKLPLPGDTPVTSLGIPRLMAALATFTFVVYLIPGLWGAPLKMLAGYLPPLYTHDFDLLRQKTDEAAGSLCDEPRYSDFLHLPHGLSGYFDYAQALKCAREQNKPLFIDFTGHGCTNCREMEAVVWSDPSVLEKLRNDFVVVALYVDDKTELPESQWYTSVYDNKVKKTIGKQNADLQVTRLQNNAQPFYVLVGKDERVLVSPYGYNRNPALFAGFLESGKRRFKELYGN
jgi:thiol:disulfide interchange protein DsbD